MSRRLKSLHPRDFWHFMGFLPRRRLEREKEAIPDKSVTTVSDLLCALR